MEAPRAVIFDVGNVLFSWSPRFLYERLIDDDRALEAFLDKVVTLEWHFQHDEGRPFVETSAELIAEYPEHAELIRAWGPRFLETMNGMIPGMAEVVADLDAAGVPLFAITNFSSEFWRMFRPAEEAIFGRFRDIVVSGDEKLVKPDPAIFHLALNRFGLAPHEGLFVDDNTANVAASRALGIPTVHFTDAPVLRAELELYGLL